MVKISADIQPELAQQIERIVRDGWFPNDQAVFREALQQFVEAKSFLGDSPRMLHRFAADALNESKPETALKFTDRALTLLSTQQVPDLSLYQMLIELRVQVLLVLGREMDAIASLEQAHEKLPNSPTISRWLERLSSKK